LPFLEDQEQRSIKFREKFNDRSGWHNGMNDERFFSLENLKRCFPVDLANLCHGKKMIFVFFRLIAGV